MVEVDGDVGVEAGVHVFEDDVLFCVLQGLGVEGARGAGFGDGVDVGPFLGGGAGSRVPFLLEGGDEGGVGEEFEEVGGGGGRVGPGVLVVEDMGFEEGFEDIEGAGDVGVEGTAELDVFGGLGGTFDEFEVGGYCAPFLVVEEAGGGVTDPGVGAATAGVDPEDVGEAKVVAEGNVEGADGEGDEGPAFCADVGFVAAGSDGIVICEINVEDEFFLERAELAVVAHGFAFAGVGGVDGTDFETGGIEAEDIAFEVVGGAVGEVTEVGVVLEGKGEFTVVEIGRGDGGVVEPLKEVAEGKKTGVKGEHYIFITKFTFWFWSEWWLEIGDLEGRRRGGSYAEGSSLISFFNSASFACLSNSKSSASSSPINSSSSSRSSSFFTSFGSGVAFFESVSIFPSASVSLVLICGASGISTSISDGEDIFWRLKVKKKEKQKCRRGYQESSGDVEVLVDISCWLVGEV